MIFSSKFKTSSHIIKKIVKVFNQIGYTIIIRADNSPFSLREFKESDLPIYTIVLTGEIRINTLKLRCKIICKQSRFVIVIY